MTSEELVPFIDKNYRTLSQPGSRVMMGGGAAGFVSIYTAFIQPGIFGMVAGQSSSIQSVHQLAKLKAVASGSVKVATKFYLDWDKYEFRLEEFDVSNPRNNRIFFNFLRELGYHVEGGEFPETSGWVSWRNRTHRILQSFFPLVPSKPMKN